MVAQSLVSVCVPPSALEEAVANHARAISSSDLALSKLLSERRHLGLGTSLVETSLPDYRAYLVERFDEVLGIDVLDWPHVSHADLVARAVMRTPPFDSKGSGYRDSLVWASVMGLAAGGADVALITSDSDFAAPDGSLADELASEVADISGTVELIHNPRSWLPTLLPWKTSDLREALAMSRHEAFYKYFLESDIQSDFYPPAEAFGFSRAPYAFEATGIEWGGSFDPVSSAEGPGGEIFTEYDIDEVVNFEAELPEGSHVEEGWDVRGPEYGGRIVVSGEVNLTVRVAVLFGKNLDFSVEELSWRRPGIAAGQAVLPHDPSQASLF